MITNLVSINIIIQEIIRDLGIGDIDIPTADMKEWIISGVKEIGVKTQFEQRRAEVKIEDYKGKVPPDFYKLDHFVNSWAYTYNKDLITDDDNDVSENEEDLPPVLMGTGGNEVRIQFRNIKTSFREGVVDMIYDGLPLDQDGYLMIADDESFSEALMWKVASKFSLRGHKFPNPDLQNFRMVNRAWRNMKKEARGSGYTPDKIMMEMLKNNFHSLVIDLDKYRTDFKTLGQREALYLDKHGRTNM